EAVVGVDDPLDGRGHVVSIVVDWSSCGAHRDDVPARRLPESLADRLGDFFRAGATADVAGQELAFAHDGFHGTVDALRGLLQRRIALAVPEPLQHHRAREDGADRIGYALA